MPGRAIISPFLERVLEGGRIKFGCRYRCLKTCIPEESPYCIAQALVAAQKGDLQNGFAFAGSNAHLATPEKCLTSEGEFISVRTLMERISDEYHAS